MPTLLPERNNGQEAPTSPRIMTALAIYVLAVVSLISLFAVNPKAAAWISQTAQAEFANEQIETNPAIVTAKLGSVALR